MGILNDNPVNYIYILPQGSEYDASDDALNPVDLNAPDAPAIYRLSATTDFDKTETATVTSNPVSLGSSMTDHYRHDNTAITFKGVISNSSASYLEQYDKFNIVNNSNGEESFVINYIKALRDLVRGTDGKSPLVTIYLPDRNGEANCVITSMKVSRDNKVSNGYYVDIVARKLQIPKENTIGLVTTSEFVKKQEMSLTGTTIDKPVVAEPLTRVY